VPIKIWQLWAPDGEAEWWYQLGYAEYNRHVLAFRLLRGLNQVYYVGVLAAWLLSLRPLLRDAAAGSAWATIGIWNVVYLTAVAVVFSGQCRYHFPLMPLLFIQIGWWLVRGVANERPQRSDDHVSAGTGNARQATAS
jgi:hypothetical protein